MNGNICNRCMAHAALAARELPLSMRSQEFRKNVQAKCFRHDVRPTSAAKRCDTREESGTQQERALKMPGNALPPGRQTDYPVRGGGSALTVVDVAQLVRAPPDGGVEHCARFIT